MTQRINISIPDELYEKLKRFKNSINVSKLCQKMLKEEIKKKENFLSRIGKPEELSEIIGRLNKEKINHMKIITDIARADGLEWAKIAHFSDLESLIFTDIDINYLGECIEPYVDEYLENKMEQMGKEYEGVVIYLQTVNPTIKVNRTNVTEVEMLYWHGWHEGVTEFWKVVKDHLFEG
ncbi:type II toxin-antitoxin system CcdA family antitoxin [Thermodesulfobacteriota bacterium]